MVAVGEHEAVLHLGRVSVRTKNEDGGRITRQQGDQSRAVLGDVPDVMKGDVDAVRAASPKEARERLDAARRVHFELGEVRIEDAQLPAREPEKPVEGFRIVASRLEQNPLGYRLGRGITHGALRCEATPRGTNPMPTEGADPAGPPPRPRP